MTTSSKLRKTLRPAVEKLVDAIVERLVTEADQQIAVAMDAAVAAITGGGTVQPEPEPEEPPARRAPRRLAVEHADDDESTTTKGKPRQRAVMRCRICGAEGYRSDGCGKTHNVPVADDDDADDDQDDPPAPRSAPVRPAASSGKPDRFAKIESSARARRGEAP